MPSPAMDRHGFAAAPPGVPWPPREKRANLDGGSVATTGGETTTYPYAAEVHPQLRTDALHPVSAAQAATIPAVYRSLQVLTTSAAQLPFVVERGGRTLKGREVPNIISRPNVNMSRGEFVEQIVLSLAIAGNAYLHIERADGQVVNIEVLNPHGIYLGQDASGRRVYHYQGKRLSAADVKHIAFRRLPGMDLGLGPIQAASGSLRLSLRQREFAGQWFDSTGQPTGILTTENGITGPDIRAAKNAWNGMDESGNPLPLHANPSGVKVLGKGFQYKPILISPRDALWVDAQNFSTLEIARLFGVPSSLLYAAIEGNSMTYSNVEQEWLAYVRFTLMDYLQPIEDALTDIAPQGQRVKFNVEGLLRSDTKTRYQAHALALSSGFLTVNEVRELEGRPPVPWGDERPQTTAAPQEATA